MSRTQSQPRCWGRCPNCGRVVRSRCAAPRPRFLQRLPVHDRCYRLLTDPHRAAAGAGAGLATAISLVSGVER